MVLMIPPDPAVWSIESFVRLEISLLKKLGGLGVEKTGHLTLVPCWQWLRHWFDSVPVPQDLEPVNVSSVCPGVPVPARLLSLPDGWHDARMNALTHQPYSREFSTVLAVGVLRFVAASVLAPLKKVIALDADDAIGNKSSLRGLTSGSSAVENVAGGDEEVKQGVDPQNALVSYWITTLVKSARPTWLKFLVFLTIVNVSEITFPAE